MPRQIRDRSNSSRQSTPAIGALFYLTFLLLGPIEVVSAQAPSFVTQPADQLVRRGDTATLTVTATGTPPLSFQWRFNGADLAFATNSTLVLTNVSPAQDGSYSVRVDNSLGSITSAGAKVTVCWDVVLSSIDKTKAPLDLRGSALLGYDNTGNPYAIRGVQNGFVLDKLSPNHEKLWEARYAEAESVLNLNFFSVDTPENIWIAGITHTQDKPDLLTIIRFNAQGQIIGITKGAISASRLAVNDHGEVFAVPGWDTFSRNQDFVIVKYNSSGEEVWRDTIISTQFPDRLTSTAVAADNDGSVLAVATLAIGNPGNTRLVLAKYDSGGRQLWISNQTFKTQLENLSAAKVALDGNIYVTTVTQDVSADFNHARKFSSTGELLWEVFQISFGPAPFSLLDANGNLYWLWWNLAQTAHLGPPYSYTTSVWKYDPLGHMVWSRNALSEPGGGPLFPDAGYGIDGAGHIAIDLFHNQTPAFTTFRFEENIVPGWPVLVSIPADGQTTASLTLSIKTEARGAPPLHFQWQLNGTDIPGANHAELRIPNAQTNHTGNYTVLITNLVGCTLSPPIYHQVIGPPSSRFDQPTFVREVIPGDNGSSITNSYFDVIIYTAAGWNYSVQSSPDFHDWVERAVIYVSTSTETPMRFPLEDTRFFRVVWRR